LSEFDMMKLVTGEGRTEQSKIGQDRTGQDRAAVFQKVLMLIDVRALIFV
jgi:hypothetical protein